MKKILAILTLCVLLAGCAAKKPVVGSANQFDSDAYLTLVTADTTIQATKAALAIPAGQPGSFTASQAAVVKTALNGLIAVYNIADSDYQIYHAAALAGTATAAQQSKVSSDLTAVQAASTTLMTAKGTP